MNGTHYDMRIRPQTLFTAVLGVALMVVAGCEGKIQAKVSGVPVYAGPHRTSSQLPPRLTELRDALVAPQAQTLSGPELSGLPARVAQATEDAAAGGAALSVAILDRTTHQLVSSGTSEIVGTASVAKLFIADDLLLQDSQGKTALTSDDRQALDTMLQSSDDDAAEKFWDQDGEAAIITEVAGRYGLTSTAPPSDGRWWNTISSVTDLVRYYEMLLDGSGGLPAERAKIIVNDLARSTPTGSDGYPQRFGIPDGLYAEPVAVKQGWMCCIGTDWVHLSTGVIGPDHRYIMVVQSLQSSDDATARETITQAVKTIFPHGRI